MTPLIPDHSPSSSPSSSAFDPKSAVRPGAASRGPATQAACLLAGVALGASLGPFAAASASALLVRNDDGPHGRLLTDPDFLKPVPLPGPTSWAQASPASATGVPAMATSVPATATTLPALTTTAPTTAAPSLSWPKPEKAIYRPAPSSKATYDDFQHGSPPPRAQPDAATVVTGTRIAALYDAAFGAQAAGNGVQRVGLRGLSLRDAIGVALARHPDISRANAIVEQSQFEIAVAEAAWYPTFEYGVQPGYGSAFGSNGTTGGMRTTLGVNQMLYDFGRANSRIDTAQANARKQRHVLADTVENTAADTASTFVTLASNQDILAAADDQVAALMQTRDKIRQRVAAGLSNKTDENQADIAVTRAEAERLKARTRMEVATSHLAELIGVMPDQVAPLTATQALIDAMSQDTPNVEQTPAVLAAQAALEEASARISFAEAERYPTIGIGISRSDSTGRQNATDNTWLGVFLRGNFSFGGLNKGQVSAARAQRQAAAQTLEAKRLTTRTALQAADQESLGAAARQSSYDRVIRLASGSRDLYWQEYTLNKRPLTEVLNAERDIYLARTEKILATGEGVQARIKAHVAVGRFVALMRAHKDATP